MNTVYKVYSGKANRCMCGCSGRYSYTTAGASAHNPGYDVSDRINERSVKIITNRIQKNPNSIREDDHMFVSTNDRILVAWFSDAQ